MHIFRLPQEKSTQSLSLFFSNFCMSHFIFIAIISCAVAFKSNASTPSNYQASTTQNPEIELNELEFALMPLTKDEVEVELNAWLVLLKNKAMIVSEAEILVSQKKKSILAAQEISEISAESAQSAKLLKTNHENAKAKAKLNEDLEALKSSAKKLQLEQAKKVIEKTPKDTENLTILSEKATVYSENLQERRNLLIENLTLLRSNKNDVLERFNIVLESWEKKGGDSEELHLYAAALSGTNVDLTDGNATWLTMKSWLVSQDGGVHWLTNFIKFFISLFVVYLLSRTAKNLTAAALSRNKKASTLLKKFIQVSVRRTVLIIGFLVSLTFIEINVAPVLALIGAAGLVVGLALQSTLSNFASGMLILIYRPFDVGDIVEIEGITGTVHSMTLLSTSIRTFDNQHIVVPNNSVWGKAIINVTGSQTRRVDLVFGIGYRDDMAKAEAIMKEILDNHELVLDEPESMVKVNELGESSVNFVCRPWVKTADYFTVYWDITRQVKEAFDNHGISIPFPQRDIHVHQVEQANLIDDK